MDAINYTTICCSRVTLWKCQGRYYISPNSGIIRRDKIRYDIIHLLTTYYNDSTLSLIHYKIGLLGLLSDEKGLFRDNTFKSVPIQNVCETYTKMYNRINMHSSNTTDNHCDNIDLLVPVTHESIVRDKELAQHMLSLEDGPGLIIGGHEHDSYHETVTNNDKMNAIHIFKSGMDARKAYLMDLVFEVPTAISDDNSCPIHGEEKNERKNCHKRNDENNNNNNSTLPQPPRPRLVDVESTLVDLSGHEPSPFAEKIINKHMSVIQALENETIIDANSVVSLPTNIVFSSKRSRFQQTTIGSIFCQMIKEELEDCDVAIFNGAVLKNDTTYKEKRISYAELKSELPFPTKMVMIQMTELELYRAILYSRTAMENGNDVNVTKEFPRRGYIQVNYDCDQRLVRESFNGSSFGNKNDPGRILNVALPRNLLNGFCKIIPLMNVGKRLKLEGKFPGSDDFVPAIQLIVRNACKNRWLQILAGKEKQFDHFDLNDDGVLDKHEIKSMMTDALGYEPASFVVDDMIGSIDLDQNETIDHDEFDVLLAQIQRENYDGEYFRNKDI